LLGLGGVAWILQLLALFGQASIQQAHRGEKFAVSAEFIDGLIVTQIVAVLVSAGLILWRGRRPIVRLAVVLWGLFVLDFLFLLIAGMVPAH